MDYHARWWVDWVESSRINKEFGMLRESLPFISREEGDLRVEILCVCLSVLCGPVWGLREGGNGRDRDSLWTTTTQRNPGVPVSPIVVCEELGGG